MLIAKYKHTYLKKPAKPSMMVGWWHCVRKLAAFLVASLASLQAVIDSLHARFRHMRVFNATKIFSSISYPMELPILYQSAHLWLQVLLNHFCLRGCILVNHDGCIYELKSSVDTLQVACARLKMHHAWAIFASTEDYLSKFPHMTQLWQMILTLPASTVSC
jgi:hypothetical protein